MKSSMEEQRRLAGVKPLDEFGMGGGPMRAGMEKDPDREAIKDAYFSHMNALIRMGREKKRKIPAKAKHYLDQALDLLGKGAWHLDDPA
jgi:hypothetical protein